MNRTKATILMTLVVIGYVLLVAAILVYLPSPWNYAVTGLLVLKGVIFAGLMWRATKIGTRRTAPPSSR